MSQSNSATATTVIATNFWSSYEPLCKKSPPPDQNRLVAGFLLYELLNRVTVENGVLHDDIVHFADGF